MSDPELLPEKIFAQSLSLGGGIWRKPDPGEAENYIRTDTIARHPDAANLKKALSGLSWEDVQGDGKFFECCISGEEYKALQQLTGDTPLEKLRNMPWDTPTNGEGS